MRGRNLNRARNRASLGNPLGSSVVFARGCCDVAIVGAELGKQS